MVGDNTHSDIRLRIFAVGATADRTDTTQHRLEDVGVVVRGLALDRTHETLEAHTGIDHFLSQRLQRTVCLAVILHEDDVPYLNHLRVVFVDQLPSRHFGALFGRTAVHVDLRTRTARTRITHLPEVIVLVAVQDMIGRQVFGPDRCCLVVAVQPFFFRALENGGIQVGRVDLQHIDDILPCEINRFLFEIVAERPVT